MIKKNISVNCIFEDDLIRPSSNGLTGQISVSIDNFSFPSLYWNDFIDLILGFWSQGIIKILKGESFVEHFTFMDGAYGFNCTRYSEEFIEIIFYKDSKRVYDSYLVNIFQFKKEIEKSINKVILHTKNNNWDYNTSFLDKQLKKLRSTSAGASL